jgi:hypothetical protein
MGDAGEGLIDAEARIQERMEEVERERQERGVFEVRNPQAQRELESLRLARVELQNQLEATGNAHRKSHLADALKEVGRRIEEASAKLS